MQEWVRIRLDLEKRRLQPVGWYHIVLTATHHKATHKAKGITHSCLGCQVNASNRLHPPMLMRETLKGPALTSACKEQHLPDIPAGQVTSRHVKNKPSCIVLLAFSPAAKIDVISLTSGRQATKGLPLLTDRLARQTGLRIHPEQCFNGASQKYQVLSASSTPRSHTSCCNAHLRLKKADDGRQCIL